MTDAPNPPQTPIKPNKRDLRNLQNIPERNYERPQTTKTALVPIDDNEDKK